MVTFRSINELHMEFLCVSEFLIEVADDFSKVLALFVLEDVLENNFNILRTFVRVHGACAPTVLVSIH
ncbi:hypothetical protein RchiOBHm_Chr4g0406191 [Rosa chinensis]|uniref:Uncharacterized protein n=1 Tax=Rosa chinensis TaxID=74649 RepID=A0A2P6QUA2_ROSCH|nr:hypothetical protein RchiOBHm_Chr4g0406191 [Rosa chinensis]